MIHWLNGFYHLEKENAVDKRDPVIIAIKERVDKEYEAGRNTVMGDGELENILKAVNYDEYERLSHLRLHRHK